VQLSLNPLLGRLQETQWDPRGNQGAGRVHFGVLWRSPGGHFGVKIGSKRVPLKRNSWWFRDFHRLRVFSWVGIWLGDGAHSFWVGHEGVFIVHRSSVIVQRSSIIDHRSSVIGHRPEE
jgi:hypothetical protein